METFKDKFQDLIRRYENLLINKYEHDLESFEKKLNTNKAYFENLKELIDINNLDLSDFYTEMKRVNQLDIENEKFIERFKYNGNINKFSIWIHTFLKIFRVDFFCNRVKKSKSIKKLLLTEKN